MSTHIYPAGVAKLFGGAKVEATLRTKDQTVIGTVTPEVHVTDDHIVLNVLCPKGNYEIASILLSADYEPLFRLHETFQVKDDGKEYVLCIPMYL